MLPRLCAPTPRPRGIRALRCCCCKAIAEKRKRRQKPKEYFLIGESGRDWGRRSGSGTGGAMERKSLIGSSMGGADYLTVGCSRSKDLFAEIRIPHMNVT